MIFCLKVLTFLPLCPEFRETIKHIISHLTDKQIRYWLHFRYFWFCFARTAICISTNHLDGSTNNLDIQCMILTLPCPGRPRSVCGTTWGSWVSPPRCTPTPAPPRRDPSPPLPPASLGRSPSPHTPCEAAPASWLSTRNTLYHKCTAVCTCFITFCILRTFLA